MKAYSEVVCGRGAGYNNIKVMFRMGQVHVGFSLYWNSSSAPILPRPRLGHGDPPAAWSTRATQIVLVQLQSPLGLGLILDQGVLCLFDFE
jgi:hypothetical protein